MRFQDRVRNPGLKSFVSLKTNFSVIDYPILRELNTRTTYTVRELNTRTQYTVFNKLHSDPKVASSHVKNL